MSIDARGNETSTRDDVTRAAEAAAAVRKVAGEAPVESAFVLGSGLSAVADLVTEARRISYAALPGFPGTTVIGHPGELVVGLLAGHRVAFFCGRVHSYEGWSARDVAFPIRVAAALGVHTVTVTNAAGGIDRRFGPGELVVISDQLNLTGDSPLRGHNDARLGPRFPDMTRAYDPELRQHAAALGLAALGRPVREAIYAGVNGPAYETPAEVRMLAVLGAGLVGMSTVHEVIAARHAGLRVFGLSLVANHAAGVTDAPLRHEDVTRAAAAGTADVARLLAALGPFLVTRESSQRPKEVG